MKNKALLLTMILTSLATIDILARNGDGTGPSGDGSCPTTGRLLRGRGAGSQTARLLKRDGAGPRRNGTGPRGTGFGRRANCPYNS